MTEENDKLRAIVDVGSNGIRFSITSLDVAQARIIPCLFQDRAAISLFDAQHSGSASAQMSTLNITDTNNDSELESSATTPAISPGGGGGGGNGSNNLGGTGSTSGGATPGAVLPDDKQEIGQDTIDEVCQALTRFKTICRDFRVCEKNIHVIATEATREATNSRQFRDKIKEQTGLEVNLLDKQEEARIGAFGVASSFYEVTGLFMDLGGGSTQLSWIQCQNGKFSMSPSPVSLPYGAAALTRRLKRGELRKDLYKEISQRLQEAVGMVQIPTELQQAADRTGGFKIYVSGGGFRGLGHLILGKHQETHDSETTYPLPIINGFSCTAKDMQRLVTEVLESNEASIVAKRHFRISERRASQLPAVSLLVSALLDSLPPIRKVLFSQGGVREGALFHELPESIRGNDPMYIATRPYAPLFADSYSNVLKQGVPEGAPPAIRSRLIYSLVNTAFVHSSYPKELQPSAALEIASVGIISGAHGLSHEIRALLGLALCQRWGGELSSRAFKDSLVEIVTPKRLAWWAQYCGHLMHVIGGVYPGGKVRGDALTFNVKDESDAGFTLQVRASATSVQTTAPTVRNRIKNLEKKLKKLRKELGDRHSLKVKVDLQWVS